jgi:hypothetical protein
LTQKFSNAVGGSLQRIIAHLLASETGKAIAIEIDEEDLARRRALVAEIEAVREVSDAQFPALVEAMTAAEKRIKAADEKLREARIAFAEASARRSELSFALARRTAAAEAELRECAPPVIANLLSELWEMFESSRFFSAPQLASKDWLGRTRPYPTTNSSARRMAAIRAAMKEATDVLPYLAIDGEELAARIAKIRASVNLPDWAPEPAVAAAE